MIELIIPPSGDPISVDVVTTLSNTLTAEHTDFPVEDGTTRTDHRTRKPGELVLEAQQSETPIDDPEYTLRPLVLKIEAVRTRVLSPTLLIGRDIEQGFASLFADPEPELFTYQRLLERYRAGDLFDRLLELYGSDDLVSVTYKSITYVSLALVGIVKTDETAGLTKFNLTFREERRFSSQRVALIDPLDLAQKPPVKIGKQQSPAKPLEEVTPPNVSALEQIRRGLS